MSCVFRPSRHNLDPQDHPRLKVNMPKLIKEHKQVPIYVPAYHCFYDICTLPCYGVTVTLNSKVMISTKSKFLSRHK